MSYQIQYGGSSAERYFKRKYKSKRPGRLPLWIGFCCILLAITLLGKLGYLDFLIPGSREITRSAFIEMVSDVQQGTDVKTAVTAFCQEILDGAEMVGY